MKNQEIKDTFTLRLIFYEKMKVFQSSIEYLRGIGMYLNYFLILCILAFTSRNFQMLDPAVSLQFLKIAISCIKTLVLRFILEIRNSIDTVSNF